MKSIYKHKVLSFKSKAVHGTTMIHKFFKDIQTRGGPPALSNSIANSMKGLWPIRKVD